MKRLGWSLLTLAGFAISTLSLAHDDPTADSHPFLVEPEVEAQVTRLANGDLRINWTPDSRPVDIYAATDPITLRDQALVAHADGARQVTIRGLDPRCRYYFALVFAGGDLLITAERFLPFESGLNFRDIGGYRTEDGRHVRWGQVYRSGVLSSLSGADRRYVAANLPLKLICDYRSLAESRADPDPALDGAALLPVPIYDQTDDRDLYHLLLTSSANAVSAAFAQSYLVLVAEKAEKFGLMLKRLADPSNLPVVYHCSAGKDRAGIATALLLRLLGVPEDTVVADFTLSNRVYDRLYAEAARNPQVAAAGLNPASLTPILVTDPRWLRAAFAYINSEFGSVENYLLRKANLDSAEIDCLRTLLLE